MGQSDRRSSFADRVRRYFFTETGRSVSERARAKRWDELLRRFPDLADMRVLDLGGTTWFWTQAPVRPRSVLVVNLNEGVFSDDRSWISTARGDACDLPAEVLARPFDLVFSNSLIEHVGGAWRRQALADTIAKLSDHYWVQTPARSFPIEPHWMFPGFQFLPVAVRAALSRRWPLAPQEFRGHTRPDAIRDVLGVELVSISEMRLLFPDAQLWHERFWGMTKSVVAVR